jgi:hypothetical protein
MKYILPLIVISATAAFGLYVINTALSLPDVHFSMITDECVKVLNYVEGENYSCENLPNKFTHVWVH